MDPNTSTLTANYVDNIGDNTAEIYLYDNIGPGGVDAGEFVKELQFLDSLGLAEIKVRINSNGGSVLDGFGIFSAIMNAKTPINTYVDGIAASIAGIIALAGQKRFIVDFGRIMIHDPHFNKPDNEVDAKEAEVLAGIKDSLVLIFTNHTEKTAEQISAIMANESWYSAEDAQAEGFIDEIIPTARIKELAAASIAQIFNAIIDNNKTEVLNPNKKIMDNLKTHFNLDENATEADVLDQIKTLETQAEALKTANETLTTDKEALEAEKETLTNAVDQLETEIANLTVVAAIKEGKVSAKDKETLVENAKKDLYSFKTILNSVKLAPVSITDTIKAADTNGADAGRNGWTIRDWEKNDPKGLFKMTQQDPDQYNKLFNDYYKK